LVGHGSRMSGMGSSALASKLATTWPATSMVKKLEDYSRKCRARRGKRESET
jgi:hypothetical protein